MIKKLRKKFIVVTMCSVMAVLCLLITTINIISFINVYNETEAKISVIALNDGTFPDFSPFPDKPDGFMPNANIPANNFSPEAPFDTRYFTVRISEQGKIIAADTERIAAINAEDAMKYAQKLFKNNKKNGFYEGYRYKATEIKSGTMYIFLDCSREMNTFYGFFFSSISVSMLSTLLIFVLVMYFSKLAIKPFAENYEKQKRFITDAGHEIKTPLTIIDAGADVIEMVNGESEWTRSIKHQVKRLSELTEKLIFLAKTDEQPENLPMADFSLSDTVAEAAESFSAIAESKGKQLYTNIDANVTIKGNQQAIQQLLFLLIDNALKYSDDNGIINISLLNTGKHREIRIYNTVKNIGKGRHDELFERFYRKDTSRNSKTGGHGIGLSSAAAIVAAHKGKISAFSEDGNSIEFAVII